MIKTIDSVDNSYFTKSEKELPEAAKDFIDEYDSLKGSAGDDNIEKINAKGDRENKYYFTKDAKTLYDYFVKIRNKENNENKEYAEKIITNIKFNTLTAQQDKEEYNKCFKTSVSDADLFLCGHIHVKKDLVSKNGVVSIVGKLLSPDESNRKPYYCYRIISARLSTDGETFDTFEINTKYLKKHFKLLKCSRASSFARKNTVVAAHVKHDQAFL